jgi:hypothetical protein
MKFLISLLVSFSLLFASSANAQLRDPTPSEKPVLDKAVTVIVKTLDQFNSDDWDKEQDFYSGEIAVNGHADVPMDIDNNFERQYHVRRNSDRYNALIKPIEEKIATAMQQSDYATVQKLGKQNKAVSWLTVDVYINRRTANVFLTNHTKTSRLNVNGIPYAYKTKGDDGETEYSLLFGNWETAQSGEYGLSYHFKHPHVTPYIENIVFILHGADDRIQQLLKTVSWADVQNALTP